jgi:hypothetical protein
MASFDPGLEKLGCVLGRWICSDGFIYSGSCQSLCAKELLLIQGHGGFVGGSSWRQRHLEFSGSTGSRDLNVISIFFRGLLKALCLVLVIRDNAQVLIMCLRLYVAKDD